MYARAAPVRAVSAEEVVSLSQGLTRLMSTAQGSLQAQGCVFA